jgi:uncharacterized RDD family membrane protein YckC
MTDPFAAPDPFDAPPVTVPEGYTRSMGTSFLPSDHAITRDGQVVRLASVGQRFLDFLLTVVLIIVTLGIGYLIWALIVWQHGQSPSKQLLKLKVIRQDNGQTATWGRMFVRSFLVAGLLGGIASSVTFGIYALVDYFTVFSKDHTRLTDRIAGTYIVPV